MHKHEPAIVPCNGCVACCQGDAVFLHPECDDDPEKYATELSSDGRHMLAHKKNADCVYLDRKEGCMIYDRRPCACRTLDCKYWLEIPRKQRRTLISKGILNKRLIEAAKARMRRQ